MGRGPDSDLAFLALGLFSGAGLGAGVGVLLGVGLAVGGSDQDHGAIQSSAPKPRHANPL